MDCTAESVQVPGMVSAARAVPRQSTWKQRLSLAVSQAGRQFARSPSQINHEARFHTKGTQVGHYKYVPTIPLKPARKQNRPQTSI